MPLEEPKALDDQPTTGGLDLRFDHREHERAEPTRSDRVDVFGIRERSAQQPDDPHALGRRDRLAETNHFLARLQSIRDALAHRSELVPFDAAEVSRRTLRKTTECLGPLDPIAGIETADLDRISQDIQQAPRYAIHPNVPPRTRDRL